VIQHKRGDTFDQLLLMPEADFPDGYFLLWNVNAQIRTPRGKLICDFVTSWADPAADTRILRLFADDTATWPLGDQEIDVQFTRQSDGLIRSTETIAIEILRDVTQL
jgi:hypothetical protein